MRREIDEKYLEYRASSLCEQLIGAYGDDERFFGYCRDLVERIMVAENELIDAQNIIIFLQRGEY